ncbi:hypothetical protein SADUNF_Sadunf12G0060900 [Salix dunnii]|uniref:Ribosomal RNA-processing protein 40 n=1 Tax=Salix dunnii TaxID=1413687 RepID=A0A835JHZ8_9ROSI|nr:hypothetical protein SADUNF_Sadunf12G0060900 [Salix dunnii]
MECKSSGSPATFVDNLVVPGDVVVDLSSMTNQTIKLGGGLRQDCDAISVMKAGKLRFSMPNKYWVETSQKRYVPCVEDSVLGIVVDSKSDNFLIDIKGPALAFLPVLAFEGGTRRNIPKFEAGTLLYVRVVKANPGMNPELSCTDASGKAAEFGALKDGYMFECSTGLSRMLLSSPTCPVLEALGKKLSFEIAVGLNGRVWVNSNSPSIVIIVANAIMNSESLSGVQQKIMAEKLLQKIQVSAAQTQGPLSISNTSEKPQYQLSLDFLASDSAMVTFPKPRFTLKSVHVEPKNALLVDYRVRTRSRTAKQSPQANVDVKEGNIDVGLHAATLKLCLYGSGIDRPGLLQQKQCHRVLSKFAGKRPPPIEYFQHGLKK